MLLERNEEANAKIAQLEQQIEMHDKEVEQLKCACSLLFVVAHGL